jgi:hypothetical protein
VARSDQAFRETAPGAMGPAAGTTARRHRCRRWHWPLRGPVHRVAEVDFASHINLDADVGARVDIGGNPYIWLGTDKVFNSFTFAFEQTSAGWVWFHAYPSSTGISTCIVECAQATWQALGFDSLRSEDSARLLEKIFEHALDGHALISQSRGEPARWLRFTQVTKKTGGGS